MGWRCGAANLAELASRCLSHCPIRPGKQCHGQWTGCWKIGPVESGLAAKTGCGSGNRGATGWHGLHPAPAEAGQTSGSLSGNYIASLLQDRQGTLWVNTDKGLDRLLHWDGQRATFEAVHRWFGPTGKDLGANFLDDASGRLWSEVAMINPQRRQMQALGKADGLDIGTIWLGAYGTTRDGLLIFGGNLGAAIIDPQRFVPWYHNPPVVLTELKIKWPNPSARQPGPARQ